CVFFFSSRRRHTSSKRDWSSDVCSSDLAKTDNQPTTKICACTGLNAPDPAPAICEPKTAPIIPIMDAKRINRLLQTSFIMHSSYAFSSDLSIVKEHERSMNKIC